VVFASSNTSYTVHRATFCREASLFLII